MGHVYTFVFIHMVYELTTVTIIMINSSTIMLLNDLKNYDD